MACGHRYKKRDDLLNVDLVRRISDLTPYVCLHRAHDHAPGVADVGDQRFVSEKNDWHNEGVTEDHIGR